MNHGSGEKSRYPDRPRISRVGVGSEWLKPVGVGRMNFTIGSDKKSGRDREIESGRMGDDNEIGCGRGL